MVKYGAKLRNDFFQRATLLCLKPLKDGQPPSGARLVVLGYLCWSLLANLDRA